MCTLDVGFAGEEYCKCRYSAISAVKFDMERVIAALVIYKHTDARMIHVVEVLCMSHW